MIPLNARMILFSYLTDFSYFSSDYPPFPQKSCSTRSNQDKNEPFKGGVQMFSAIFHWFSVILFLLRSIPVNVFFHICIVDWNSLVVGKISPWLQPDSRVDVIRKNSEAVSLICHSKYLGNTTFLNVLIL